MTKGKIVGTFPFGQPVRLVEQTDRTPKRAFVLGVYSSAVHAKWLGLDGKVRVHALAVASEPALSANMSETLAPLEISVGE